jgi:hypothetical protein
MPQRICTIEDCGNKVVARGYCTKHYQRWAKYGDPNVSKPRKRGTCSIDNCNRPAAGRGWCTLHYQRWRKHGDPLAVIDRSAGTCSFDGCERKHYALGLCHSHWKQTNRGDDPAALSGIAIPFEERLWSYVTKTESCWLWTGPLTDQNYGYFHHDRERWAAHRYFYTRFCEPIPEGLEIDHRCFVTNCVNPDHLRLATRKQQNEYRQGAQKHSKTGVRGVWLNGNKYKKYSAGVGHNGKSVHVGTFYTIEEAEAAVRAKRKELHSYYS